MRFLYKRPKIREVSSELDTLMEVMLSDGFIIIDLFFICIGFGLLLFSVLHSIVFSTFIFLCSFFFFSMTYLLFFKQTIKRK